MSTVSTVSVKERLAQKAAQTAQTAQAAQAARAPQASQASEAGGQNGQAGRHFNDRTKDHAATTTTPPDAAGAYLKTIEGWLKSEAFKNEIARVLPRHLDPDRLVRSALTAVRQTPALLQATPASLFAALLQAAQLGLEPGPLGHVHIVTRYNRRLGQTEARLMVDYRGYLELIRRSGQVQSVQARIVYANDLFELEFGLQDRLRHVPWSVREGFSEPGDIRGAYLLVRFRDGGHFLHYMPKAKIDERRRRSEAPDNGPWATDYEAMALKTVVRDAVRWLPISIEDLRLAAAVDEAPEVQEVPVFAYRPPATNGEEKGEDEE